MVRVVVAPAASADLDELSSLDAPPDTHARLRERLLELADFPLRGEALSGRWAGVRYVLGP